MQSGGDVTFNGGSLDVSGAWTLGGGNAVTRGGGTFSAQDLIVQNGSQLTLVSGDSITGSVQVNSGSVLDSNGLTFAG